MKNFQIERMGGELRLSWRWKSRSAWALLFMSIFWNAIVGVFILGMLLDGGENIWFFLPISLHFFVGLFLAYYTVASFFNTTVITAGHYRLKASHGPVPWWGNRDYAVREIDQLFVVAGGSETVNGNKTILYSVRAKLTNGKSTTLATSIRTKDQALDIERLIEKHLNIEDVPVHDNPLEDLFKKHFPKAKLPPLPGPINEGKGGAAETPKFSDIPPPRQDEHLSLDTLDVAPGEVLHLMDRDYVLAARTQLDWGIGTTDRQILLRTASGEELHIYAEDRGDRGWSYLEERQLSPKEWLRLGLNTPDRLPNSFLNGEEKYYQREELLGYAHPQDGPGRPVRQWIYFTTTSHVRFRVLTDGKEVQVFVQEPIAERAILAAR